MEPSSPGRELCQRTHDARTIIAFLAVSLSLRIAGAELRPIGTCEKRNPPQDREPEITDDPDQVETRPRRIRHRHLS